MNSQPASDDTVKSPTVNSMTGYAQARAEHDGLRLRVSLRSVNHRFLDVRVRLPEGFEMFEPPIRGLLRDRLRRGHVEVTLHIETARGPAIQIHQDVAETYLRAIEEIKGRLGILQQPDLVALLRLPGVVGAAGAPGAPGETSNAASDAALDPEDPDALARQVTACVEEALDRLEEMRRAEGSSLAQEMRRQTKNIGEMTARMEVLTERSRPAYALRLRARIEELLGGGPMDAARLAQEAALLAERADVSEELARLRSHVGQFDKLVAGAGEIGKKLDFLLQEMQREANTLLSKTPGLGEEGLDMTELGLQIKAEIEKLREQVQNVE